jgi:streptogramin lyase
VAVDAAGNLWIADQNNHRIRKVDAVTGIITTEAGTGGAGFNGDNGPADAAQLSSPGGVAINAAGDLWIADQNNHRIRRVGAVTGTIITVAGTGGAGFNGDNIAATLAQLRDPSGVAVNAAGDLWIADLSNNRIRKVEP